MNRYWDYSEKERAELTEEQVKSMLTVEMMEKGVLDPGPSPEIVKPTEVVLTKKTFHRVKYDSYSKFDALFATLEQSQAFVALKPGHEGYDYQLGDRTDYAQPVKEYAIEAVELADYDDVMRNQAELKRIGAINATNKKKIELHAEAVKKANKVTDGVWEDWQDCKHKNYSHKSLLQTFDNYVKVADGNRSTARKFLAKAYPEPEIAEAFAWCCISDPATEAA